MERRDVGPDFEQPTTGGDHTASTGDRSPASLESSQPIMEVGRTIHRYLSINEGELARKLAALCTSHPYDHLTTDGQALWLARARHLMDWMVAK